MKIKANFPALVAILVPLIFIMVLTIAVYVPGRTIKLANSFVYTLEYDRYAPTASLAAESVTKADYYLYDHQTNQTKKLSESEFKQLRLDLNPRLDGQSITHGYDSSDPVSDLFGSDYSGVYLNTDVGDKKLFELDYDDYFIFQGWVIINN